MVDAIVPAQQSTGLKALDSLSANEFAVEIDGERVEGVFSVTGLVAFKLDVKTTNALKIVKDPFKITKMVHRDPQNVVNRWLRESIDAKADIVRPKRTVAIIAIDDGEEVRRWTVNGAWISEISYSDFNSGSSALVEETITIQWEEMEENWLVG
ncbi:MAG: phage tail protein [Chloroflexota bacterium]